MLWILDVFIGGIGFIAGAGVAGLVLKNKIKALEGQLFQEQERPLCKDCKTSQLLAASEAAHAAVVEDRDRMIACANKYRSLAYRLAKRLRGMTA